MHNLSTFDYLQQNRYKHDAIVKKMLNFIKN